MTDEEYKRDLRRAYSRGYSAGRGRRWPDFEPLPPEPKIRALAEAARDLSSETDCFLAQFDDRDDCELLASIDAARDRVMDALESLSDFSDPQNAKSAPEPKHRGA